MSHENDNTPKQNAVDQVRLFGQNIAQDDEHSEVQQPEPQIYKEDFSLNQAPAPEAVIVHTTGISDDVVLKGLKSDEPADLALPSSTTPRKAIESFTHLVKELEDKEVENLDEQLQKFIAVTANAMKVAPKEQPQREANGWINPMFELGTKASDGIEVNGEVITPNIVAKPRKLLLDNINDGTNAVQLQRSLGGSVNSITTYLPNTCMWVRVDPPREDELIALFKTIDNDISAVGRETYGVPFSASGVMVYMRIAEFLLARIKASSVKSNGKVEPISLENIKYLDIFLLMMVVIDSRYTKGITFSRACMVNPDRCSHVHTEDGIRALKLIKIINSNMSEEHRKFMANKRMNSVTVAEMKEMQSKVNTISNNSYNIALGDDQQWVVTLQSTTAAQYIDEGLAWVDETVSTLEEIAGADETERDVLVTAIKQTSRLRAYSSAIYSIKIVLEEGLSPEITNRDAIVALLNDVSANNTAMVSIREAIDEYTGKSVVLIGTDDYICPNCGQSQTETGDHVLPIDAQAFFMNWLFGVVSQITNRT